MYCLIKTKSNDIWYLNEYMHRINGPATEFLDGEKWWLINGKRHRENNLPAIIRKDGNEEYWINGEEYLFHENGTKEFIDYYGRLSRVYGAAVEYPNGDKEWWIDGKRHRLDGPAVIIGDKKFWFFEGEFIKCMI